MIGSNSSALRQHAYSVFTASRRERERMGSAPESVRRPRVTEALEANGMARSEPTPERLVEVKRRSDQDDATTTTPPPVAGLLGSVLAPKRARLASLPTPEEAWEPTQDEIRRRAYEIFEARQGAPGDPVADWLRAEGDLRRERNLN